MGSDNFDDGKGGPLYSIETVCDELCKKRLSRLRCRLDCRLGGAQGSVLREGAHWRHLSNTIELSM